MQNNGSEKQQILRNHLHTNRALSISLVPILLHYSDVRNVFKIAHLKYSNAHDQTFTDYCYVCMFRDIINHRNRRIHVFVSSQVKDQTIFLLLGYDSLFIYIYRQLFIQ